MIHEASTQLPTEFGTFNVHIYRNEKNEEVTAICSGAVQDQSNLPVRVHSACFTAEALGSLKCDCKLQLDYALDFIRKNNGIVIYLPQEGRGIGLSNKIRAYALQEKGHDTIEANRLLGLPIDGRTYEDARDILKHLNVRSIQLLTNNPLKLSNLSDLGVKVMGRLPVICEANKHSASYLKTKQKDMGHLIDAEQKNHTGQVFCMPKRTLGPRPFTHVNLAITDQAEIADNNGQQLSISCSDDWRRVHELREQYQAVAVGAKTWVRDKPRLTARTDILGRTPKKQPARIIFSGHHDCYFESEEQQRKTFIIGRPKHHPNKNFTVISSDTHDLKQPLDTLQKLGVESVLVEGGLCLIASFIKQKMVDLLTVYVRSNNIAEAITTVSKLFPELSSDQFEAKSFGKGTLLSVSLVESADQTHTEFGVSA